MSYRDVEKGRERELSEVPGQSVRQVESSVFKLNSGVSQLRKLVDQLGGAKDTSQLRHRIADANASIQDQARRIKEQVTALNMAPPPGGAGSSGQQQAHEAEQQKARKLLQDFASILRDYKATQKVAAEREAAHLPRPSPGGPSLSGVVVGVPVGSGSGDGGGGTSGTLRDVDLERQALLQEQQQVKVALMENAIQYHDALIEERDTGIAEIHRQIGEVNEMFQDLAVLINDQGTQIVHIDDHISSTANLAQDGARELTKALRSQSKTRNTCLWIWLGAALVVSIILILSFA